MASLKYIKYFYKIPTLYIFVYFFNQVYFYMGAMCLNLSSNLITNL